MRFRLALAAPLLFALVTTPPAGVAAQQKPAPSPLPLAIAWDTSLDGTPAAPPAFDDTHAFLALQAADERPASLVALALADGTVSWRQPLDGVRSLAAGDSLVFGATADSVFAFAASDGQPAWTLAIDSPPAALVTAGGWLVLAAEKELVAIRAREGTIVWRQALGSGPSAPPVFAGDAIYVGLADAAVLRMTLTTGAIVWRVTLPGTASTMLALDDRVFVGTRGRYFYALDPRKGGKHWRVRVGSDVVGTPALDRSLVYFLSLDNLVRGVDRGNGTLRAREVLTRRALFGPFPAGDLLLVSGITQTIEGFRAGTLKPAGTYDAFGRDQAGVRFAGPVHVAAGTTGSEPLIVGVTGEGEVIALRRTK